MGERSQHYVFVKDEKGKIHGTGIHHQWNFGFGMGLNAVRMMEYQKKAAKDQYHPFTRVSFRGLEETTECLKAIYALNEKEASFTSSVHYIGDKAQDKWEKDCVNDPRHGDNNDGITVFDFTDTKNPLYALMNIHSQDYDEGIGSLPEKQPVSVEAYVRAFYPLNGNKYQKEHWKPKDFITHEKQLISLFKRAEKFKVMTLARAKTLMPGLYAAELSVREKAIAAAKVGKMI